MLKVSAIPSNAAKQEKRSIEIDRVRRQSFELTSPPLETTTGTASPVPPKIRQRSGSAISASKPRLPPPFQRSISASELKDACESYKVYTNHANQKQYYSPQLSQVIDLIYTLSAQDRELLILYLHETSVATVNK